ncbi:TIGR03943 family putative permease subunit [Mycobacterium sp. BMJ-28]
MSKVTQNTLVLLIGLSAGLLVVKATYLNFVKPGLLPWLISAAVLLVVLGLAGFVADARHGAPDQHHHHGTMAWLLLIPVALTAFVAVPAMGVVGATPESPAAAQPHMRAFPPLPADGSVSLPEMLMRAAADSSKSLDNRTITTTGFTMGTDLARVVIICCAADAQLARIHLSGNMPEHPDDTWLRVEGRVVPGTSNPSTHFIPTLEVTRAIPIPKPANTYAY